MIEIEKKKIYSSSKDEFKQVNVNNCDLFVCFVLFLSEDKIPVEKPKSKSFSSKPCIGIFYTALAEIMGLK